MEVVEINGLIEVVEVGIQGAPGIQGPMGSAGTAYITLLAGAGLGGGRLVIDAATYADSSIPAHLNKVIGFNVGAVALGASASIQIAGELDGFSGLTVNPVYLSTNGTITQSLPTSGFIQQVGNAISPTKIIVNFSPPISLL